MRSGVRSGHGKKQVEVQAVMEELADELQRVAEGPAGPPVRCAALEALLWFQVRRCPLPGLRSLSYLMQPSAATSPQGWAEGRAGLATELE